VNPHDPAAPCAAADEGGAGPALQWLAAQDDELVAAFDAAVSASVARAGDWVRCRIGCTECCVGPFDITALDAWRLRRGLRALAAADPGAAAAVRQRARRQWAALRRAFPGNRERGRLDDDEAAREAFFARFADLPCPALEEREGRCLVYPFRPLSCRSFGVPIGCGGAMLPPCRLNFVGAPAGAVEAATVDPDPHDREGVLLARLEEATGQGGDSIVAAALALDED